MMRIFGAALLILGMAIAGTQPLRADDLTFVAGPIPPYTFKTDGKPDGAATLIVAAIARELGVPFHLEFQPWMRAQLTAQRGKNIGIIPLSRTPEREPLYKWVGPLIFDREILFTIASNKTAPASLDEAKLWVVCALRGSPGEMALKSFGFTRVYAATEPEACARRLAAATVDAWLAAELVAPYQFKLVGLDPTILSRGAEVRNNNTYLGLSTDVSDDVVLRWQQSLDRMRTNGKVTAIMKSFE